MTFDQSIQEKMNRFAQEQSRHYLDDAEMTYVEILRRNSGRTRDKVKSNLARFKTTSEKSREAKDDMVLYMNDYMSDLVSRGMTAEEALEKAQEELAFDSKSDLESALKDRYQQYYAALDPSVYEAVGLYYGAGMMVGLVIGGLGGLLLGSALFAAPIWISVATGAGAGCILGLSFGMIKHAGIIRK